MNSKPENGQEKKTNNNLCENNSAATITLFICHILNSCCNDKKYILVFFHLRRFMIYGNPDIDFLPLSCSENNKRVHNRYMHVESVRVGSQQQRSRSSRLEELIVPNERRE